MMGILACSTDSEPQISTIQLKQMTLLHYYKYFQIAHLMIHENIWKPLQLYGRATHGCSCLSPDCRPFWTASPSLGFNRFLGFWGTRIGVIEALIFRYLFWVICYFFCMTCPSFIVRVDDRYNDPLIDIHDVSNLWSLEDPQTPQKSHRNCWVWLETTGILGLYLGASGDWTDPPRCWHNISDCTMIELPFCWGNPLKWSKRSLLKVDG